MHPFHYEIYFKASLKHRQWDILVTLSRGAEVKGSLLCVCVYLYGLSSFRFIIELSRGYKVRLSRDKHCLCSFKYFSVLSTIWTAHCTLECSRRIKVSLDFVSPILALGAFPHGSSQLTLFSTFSVRCHQDSSCNLLCTQTDLPLCLPHWQFVQTILGIFFSLVKLLNRPQPFFFLVHVEVREDISDVTFWVGWTICYRHSERPDHLAYFAIQPPLREGFLFALLRGEQREFLIKVKMLTSRNKRVSKISSGGLRFFSLTITP